MLIDPFVVIAQIINFLILVALLKRFLYTHGSPIFEQGVQIGLESYHEKACNRNNRKSR